jgi:hypothetical protein
LKKTPTPKIIDIHSPSHTGKTHLLYYLITQTILPEYLPRHSVRISASPSQAVFFFDCDVRFDIHRLQKVITTFIKGKFAENLQGGFIHHTPVPTPSDEEIHQVGITALSNLYIFQPTSPLSLLTSIKGLPTLLSQSEYGNISLGLVCIDSFSTIYHVLRTNEKQHEYYSQFSYSLHSFATLFSIPVISTSWALFAQTPTQLGETGYLGTGPSHPNSVSSLRPVWRQYFPGEWLRGVDARIILQKQEVRGFMAGIMLVEAEMETERRMEVVKRGTVAGWVEGDEGSDFEMFITEDGVRISSQ